MVRGIKGDGGEERVERRARKGDRGEKMDSKGDKVCIGQGESEGRREKYEVGEREIEGWGM